MNNKTKSEKENSAVRNLLHSKEIPVLIIILVLCVALSFASPYFLTSANIMTTMIGLSTDGIIAIAMTIILAMGGIDLSVGSVLGLSCMSCSMIASTTGNVWLGAIVGLLIGLVCGIINGIFIAKVKLTPFIMTLAMMSIARGIAMMLSSGKTVSAHSSDAVFNFLGQGFIGGIFPFLILVFLILVVLFSFLLKKTSFFRNVFYVGSNENAARLSGINVDKTKLLVYSLVGLICGFCGVLNTARFGSCTPTTGDGLEMTAISAAVIGGASLSGGEGSIIGAFFGILLLNIVDNGMVLLNVSVYGQDLVSGLILLAAVTFDIVSSSRRAKRGK